MSRPPIVSRDSTGSDCSLSLSLAHSLRTAYSKLFLRPLPFSSYVYGQALILVGYVAVFLFCLLFDTSSPRTNWRRPGCIAAAQLPWLFLFATKNNLLALVGMGYEKVPRDRTGCGFPLDRADSRREFRASAELVTSARWQTRHPRRALAYGPVLADGPSARA